MSVPLIAPDDKARVASVASALCSEADLAAFLGPCERTSSTPGRRSALRRRRSNPTRPSRLQEHRGDHRPLLDDLGSIGRRPRWARLAEGCADVRKRLPAWPAVHAATMDSALVAHPKIGSGD